MDATLPKPTGHFLRKGIAIQKLEMRQLSRSYLCSAVELSNAKPSRNIGSTQRIKYGLLGDGVNLAARMKGLMHEVDRLQCTFTSSKHLIPNQR